MTFMNIPYLLFFGLVIGSIFLLRHLKKRGCAKIKSITLGVAVTLIVLYIAISIVPSFLSFKTAEAAFRFYNFGKIEQVIHGENSCCILYVKKKSTWSNLILPYNEEEGTYQIPLLSITEEVGHASTENGWLNIYHVKGTEDFYVSVFHTTDGDYNLSDTQGSTFHYITSPMKGTNYVTYFAGAYVKNLADDYCVIINDDTLLQSDSSGWLPF